VTTQPENAARPRQVTTAVWLLALFPLLIVVTVVVTFMALNTATSNADRLIEELSGRQVQLIEPETAVKNLLSTMRAQVLAGTFVKVVQAVVLGGLAVFVRRGSQGARIGVYIVAALTSVGAAGLVVLTILRRTLYAALERRSANLGGVFVNESDLLPGWYDWYNYAIVTLSIGLAGAVVWLLTRPASNDYFRRRQRPPVRAPWGAPGPYPPQHQQQPYHQQQYQRQPGQPWPQAQQHPPGQQSPYGPPRPPGPAR
jgi:hypothetical protein